MGTSAGGSSTGGESFGGAGMLSFMSLLIAMGSIGILIILIGLGYAAQTARVAIRKI
jgi:hypothetical protein